LIIDSGSSKLGIADEKYDVVKFSKARLTTAMDLKDLKREVLLRLSKQVGIFRM
jgi:hypothetical protein